MHARASGRGGGGESQRAFKKLAYSFRLVYGCKIFAAKRLPFYLSAIPTFKTPSAS